MNRIFEVDGAICGLKGGLERWVDTVASNPGLYGDLFELTAKSEDVYKRDYVTLHISYKYQDAKYGEVDLFSQGILLMECAVGPKKICLLPQRGRYSG